MILRVADAAEWTLAPFESGIKAFEACMKAFS